MAGGELGWGSQWEKTSKGYNMRWLLVTRYLIDLPVLQFIMMRVKHFRNG